VTDQSCHRQDFNSRRTPPPLALAPTWRIRVQPDRHQGLSRRQRRPCMLRMQSRSPAAGVPAGLTLRAARAVLSVLRGPVTTSPKHSAPISMLLARDSYVRQEPLRYYVRACSPRVGSDRVKVFPGAMHGFDGEQRISSPVRELRPGVTHAAADGSWKVTHSDHDRRTDGNHDRRCLHKAWRASAPWA